MINNEKNSIDFYADKIWELECKYEIKAISNSEYMKLRIELMEQAKKMYDKEIIMAFNAGSSQF